MIEVYSSGYIFENWNSLSISRSLDQIAGGFELTLVNRDINGDPVRLFPLDSIKIKLNGIDVLEGYVDSINAGFTANGSQITIAGSEKTCDLADCSFKATEWLKKDFKQIANDVCKEFGLNLDVCGVDLGNSFEKFSSEPADKAIDVLSKLCAERGVLMCSDGLGGLKVFNPENSKVIGNLKQGENLISARVTLSSKERYSEYTIYGTGNQKKQVKDSVKDEEITRNRPFELVDSNATEKDKVKARGNWEKNIRKAKSLAFECEVLGWEVSNGTLWDVGSLCSVHAPECCINEPMDLLIESLNFSYSLDDGEKTSLTLVQKDSFIPEPISEKVTAVKSVKVANDPWKKIKNKVKGT